MPLWENWDGWKMWEKSSLSASLPLPISESPLLLPLPLCPGKSSHLKGPDHHELTHGGTHSHSHEHKVVTLSCTYTHSHTRSHSQSPTQPQGQTGTHTQKVSESHQESPSLSLSPLIHTAKQRFGLTQLQKYTPGHTHTYTLSHKVSLTHRQIQSNTQSHTERNRHTQLHTGPWRYRTMGALSGLAAAGEKRAAVWMEGAVGAAVPPPLTPAASQASSPFQKLNSAGTWIC